MRALSLGVRKRTKGLPAPKTLPPAFRAWFKGSVIVDEATGAPQVMFHGTKAEFTEFNPGETGVFFSADRKSVGKYAGKGGRVLAVYLSIKNPYITDLDGWDGEAWSPETIKEEGEHDGYIVRDWAGEGRDLVIAFEPTQIKSATENSGAFDPDSPAFRE